MDVLQPFEHALPSFGNVWKNECVRRCQPFLPGDLGTLSMSLLA